MTSHLVACSTSSPKPPIQAANRTEFLHIPNDVLRYKIFPLLDKVSQSMLEMSCRRLRGVCQLARKGKKNFHLRTDLLCAAARLGYKSILEANPKNWPLCWQSRTLVEAILGGHTELAKWLYEKKCPRNSTVTAAAAQVGNTNLLQWLYQQGCPLDKQGDSLDKSATWFAAHSGHLKTLQWIMTQIETPNIDDLDSEVTDGATEGGQLGILQWLHAQNRLEINEDHRYTASRVGYSEVMDYFHALGHPRDEYDTYLAASKGDLKTLEELDAEGIERDPEIFQAAAKGGIQVLEYLKSKGVVWMPEEGGDQQECYIAAKLGDLAVLKWFKQNSFEDFFPTQDASLGAAERGDLRILEWLKANGDLDHYGVSNGAALGGHREVLAWLVLHHYPVDVRAFKNALITSNIEMIKWFYENNVEFIRLTEEKLTADESRKYLDEQLLQWARENDQREILQRYVPLLRKI